MFNNGRRRLSIQPTKRRNLSVFNLLDPPDAATEFLFIGNHQLAARLRYDVPAAVDIDSDKKAGSDSLLLLSRSKVR